MESVSVRLDNIIFQATEEILEHVLTALMTLILQFLVLKNSVTNVQTTCYQIESPASAKLRLSQTAVISANALRAITT